MKVIHKYAFLPEPFMLKLPEGAQVLSVQVQRGEPCMWVRVDTDARARNRWFHVTRTDEPLPEGVGRHLGTLQLLDDTHVLHVFETAAPA